jgi:hypothetical protein
MRQCRFEDGGNSWIGNQRLRAPDGLRIVVIFLGLDKNAARPQQPCLDADLNTHTLHGAREGFLYPFGVIDRLPELLRALTTRHVAGLR